MLTAAAATLAVAALPIRMARAADRRAVTGPSIQIDPTFPYYLDRTVESVADEIAANGYRTVHYYVVNELSVNRALIDAFHRRDIAVWAMVVGNGSYAVEGWPDGWQNWQMQLVKNIDWGGFHLFTPFSDAYVRWKKHLASTLVSAYPFDGYEIAEPYFPDWDGLTSGIYGDIGAHAQQAFQREHGLEIPNFTDPASSLYYKNDEDRYNKWMQLRVDAVNGYVNEIINGPGGVRQTRRDILVGTWSLGIDAGPDSVALEREYQGLDAGAMTALVRPDVHIVQTNWPDWVKPDLPPTYVKTYEPFVKQIRTHNRKVPIGVQTDIGSQLAMARDDVWIQKFSAATREMGLSTWTAYEYFIGRYMYDDPPVPRWSHVSAPGEIEVSFQKRIDAASATKPGSFTLISAHGRTPISPTSVTADGNRVILNLGGLPKGELHIAVQNVTDAPGYRLYKKDGPANVVPAGTVVKVSTG